jgi:MYXO-CTERM domain-containing protein
LTGIIFASLLSGCTSVCRVNHKSGGGIVVKEISKGLAAKLALLLALVGVLTSVGVAPALAQTATPGVTTTQVDDDVNDDNDGFPWGLLGLLGLAGLAGLTRREEPRRVERVDVDRTDATRRP